MMIMTFSFKLYTRIFINYTLVTFKKNVCSLNTRISKAVTNVAVTNM